MRKQDFWIFAPILLALIVGGAIVIMWFAEVKMLYLAPTIGTFIAIILNRIRVFTEYSSGMFSDGMAIVCDIYWLCAVIAIWLVYFVCV